MTDKNSIEKIESDRKQNIQKTMDHPINQAIKDDEIKKTISSSRKEKNLPENQISLSLDKYENRIIKKRKFYIN
ncbi:hypothetical protein K9M48_03045 [Candidatus Gracilibacteria bacterium]|nr:hypothetical protein [Candidatus Gracilibacteria bacterium]